MRYTTVIDISEIAEIYRNPAAVRVYIHLALNCGYHDYDRDIYTGSIRRLMADLGLSLSATRHAIKVLQAHNLVRLQGGVYVITKYIPSETITPRPKTAKQVAQQAETVRRNEAQQTMEAAHDENRRQLEAIWAQGKSSWMVFYENRQKLAQAGDQEAAKWCERNRQQYEQEAARMKDFNQKNGKK